MLLGARALEFDARRERRVATTGFQAKPKASCPAQMLSPLAPIVYVPVVDSTTLR
jgi:hypothetical protein